MKTKLSVLLVLILLFGCMTSAHAEQEGTTVNSEISSQISLIHDHINDLFQPDIGTVWYYSIMDFDHNGRLEFFAATQHPADRSTSLKVWEVTEDLASLTECTIVKDPDESFPDILSNIWIQAFIPSTYFSEDSAFCSRRRRTRSLLSRSRSAPIISPSEGVRDAGRCASFNSEERRSV